MIKSRNELEAEETAHLFPYAVRSADSVGRVIPEEPHPYRTHFQRDRARVIHSSAFRRLDGKTQVFLNGSGDHYRTRLTHTMEVASVARTIARALGLNEDLAETIALAHDLGHPPFGHSGEEELDRLMRADGGFDHNEQSLRVVEWLEEKYPQFPGLNLSREVLEGMCKHGASAMGTFSDGIPHAQICLEGQVADVADEITYHSHDLDDGLDSGLVPPERLEKVALWCEAREKAQHDLAAPDTLRDRGFIIRCLINRLVDDLVRSTSRRLQEEKISSVDAVRRHPRRLVAFSENLREQNAELKRFLYREFYHHSTLAKVHSRTTGWLDVAFERFLNEPTLLGSKAARRVERWGLPRTVCDYLAGMTDRYFLATLEKIGIPIS